MKIAISTDGQYVSPHFGRCPTFTILEIENNKVMGSGVFDLFDKSLGALNDWQDNKYKTSNF